MHDHPPSVAGRPLDPVTGLCACETCLDMLVALAADLVDWAKAEKDMQP